MIQMLNSLLIDLLSGVALVVQGKAPCLRLRNGNPIQVLPWSAYSTSCTLPEGKDVLHFGGRISQPLPLNLEIHCSLDVQGSLAFGGDIALELLYPIGSFVMCFVNCWLR